MQRIIGKPMRQGRTHFLVWCAVKVSPLKWQGHWSLFANGTDITRDAAVESGVVPRSCTSELRAERAAYDAGAAHLQKLDATDCAAPQKRDSIRRVGSA